MATIIKTKGKNINGSSNNEGKVEKKSKVPKRDQVVKKLGKQLARFRKVRKYLDDRGAGEKIIQACDLVIDTMADSVILEIEKLPDTFGRKQKESGEGGGKSFKFEEGEAVALRPKKKEEYKDLLLEGDMESMLIMKVIGTRARVRTKSGVELVLPRAAFTAVSA